jgi:hypothetical protein
MRIAFVGHGKVGAPLASRLQGLGHEVTLGARDPGSRSVRVLCDRHPGLSAAPIAAAARAAQLVFLAVPFSAIETVLPPLADALAGKTLVDCTNPVGVGIAHGLGSVRSGSEVVQAMVPAAHVVKAFSIYGFENFEDDPFPQSSVRPAMFFCGDDLRAKEVVAALVDQLGWQPLDVGGLEQALHLEHMTLLWIRLVRVHGHSPHLAWAVLRR